VLRSLEDDQAFPYSCKLLHFRIGAREMRAQLAFFGAIAVDQEGRRIGLRSARTRGDDEAERISAC
jgi:hypothetical protein